MVAGHPEVDAVIVLGMGIQDNQGRLEREGPFYPEWGLERIVDFHGRQDSRYADAAADASAATGKPVLLATELSICAPDNAAVRATRARGRLCHASSNRAVAALDQLWRYARWRQHRALDAE
jgi:acetyltransferase